MAEMRILVVYYSRGGNSRAVAEEIARALGGADLEEIRDTVDRRGFRGYLRSGRDAMRHATTVLVSPGRDVRGYDEVVVGTPVWAGNVSTPTRTWLVAHAGELRRVALFLTYGGAWAERVLTQMTQLAGLQPEAVLAIRKREMGTRRCRARIAAFAIQLSARLVAAAQDVAFAVVSESLVHH